jgi:hypothetical protein
MAKELGLNPNKFGKLANNKQDPCKASLPDFIADLYYKRFVYIKNFPFHHKSKNGSTPHSSSCHGGYYGITDYA